MRPSDSPGWHMGGLPSVAPRPGRRRGCRPRIGGAEQAENDTNLTLVGLARTGSTDLVVERIHIHEESAARVQEGEMSGGIQADRVALDHVPSRERAEKLDANKSIA